MVTVTTTRVTLSQKYNRHQKHSSPHLFFPSRSGCYPSSCPASRPVPANSTPSPPSSSFFLSKPLGTHSPIQFTIITDRLQIIA